MARLITFGGSGSAGPPGPAGASATPPDDFTIDSVAANWRVTRTGRGGLHNEPTLQLTVAVTPPSPIGTAKGGHLYAEIPDQSSTTPMRLDGSAPMDGTRTMQGQWTPIDLGKYSYIAEEQPWVFEIPESVSIPSTTSIRLYVAAYSEDVDNVLVQAGLSGETPSMVVSVEPYSASAPNSGANVTHLLVPSISASVAAAVTVAGKLRRPISVTVSLTGLSTPLPDNWAFQLLGYVDGDLGSVPLLTSGLYTAAGIAEAEPDGISTAHTFGPEEPTVATSITIYAVAGLFQRVRGGSRGNIRTEFVRNNIVDGITASAVVTIGTATGVTDPTALMQAYLNATMSVLNGLFGVAPAGISNTYLGALSVATGNIQSAAVALGNMATLSVDTAQLINSAVSTAKMAALSVTATQLASSSVTATAIANLAVGTAAINTAAVTTAKIGSAQITTALIANAAITTALIANAAITTALIANAAITTALIANLAVGTAQIASLAVTDAKIADLSVDKLIAGTIDVASSTTPAVTVRYVGASIYSSQQPIGFQVTVGSNLMVSLGGLINGFLQLYNNLGSQTVEMTAGHTGFSIAAGLQVSGNYVVKARQTGPGSPSFATLSDAQTWCSNLYNALRASGGHGLVN
jgi:hypothetical protein